jgi:hypothetical protein
MALLARGWITGAMRRDGAASLSPVAEELRLALLSLRAGRAGPAAAAMRRAAGPLRGVASSALGAARRALAAGNQAAAEAALARALLAAV